MKSTLPTVFLLIIQLYALPIESYSQEQDYRFEHFTRDQGLSQNLVKRIFQDSEGFMWFFTANGLNKYDGYNIEVYRPEPDNPDQSLKDPDNYNMIEDEQGRLWITSWGGGLQYLDKRTNQVTHVILDSLNENNWIRLVEIFQSKDGSLWVSGFYGIAHVDPLTLEVTLFDAREDKSTLYAVVEDASKRVWCGGLNGLFQLDPQTGIFTPITLDSTLQQPPLVHHLYLDRDGILWVSTQTDGLFTLDTKLESPQPQLYLSAGVANEKDKIVFRHVTQSRQGHLWVSSSRGVVRIDKKKDEIKLIQADPQNPFSISHNGVWCVYEDQSENLWVGTVNGLDKLLTTQFHTYQIRPNSAYNFLPANSIWSLAADQVGDILFTTRSDSANTFDHAILYRLSLKTGEIEDFLITPNNSDTLKNNQVGPLYVDLKNRLWIGTETALLLRNNKTGGFTHYSSQIPVFSITEDPFGKLWFYGGLHSSDHRMASFNPENGDFSYYSYDFLDAIDLPSFGATHIMASRTGDIWLSFYGGLARFDQKTEKYTTYLPNPQDPEGNLNSIFVFNTYEDSEGIIWIGTGKDGLNRYDPSTDKFTHFDMLDGLPSNEIYGIIGDKNGNLWVGTNRGLSRFNPKTKEFRNYDVSDGLLSDIFHAPHAIGKEGKLIFGTDNGLLLFHPDSIKDNTDPPPVYITGFKVMEENQAVPNEPIELPYDQNFLSFDFVALNYQAPEKNAYAYLLEGLDEDWVYSGDRRFASYTNLDPGEYTFKVKASHNKGPWNEAASTVQFTILPPWWQTWWAYALYAMLALGAIVVLRHYEMKRFKLRQRATHLAEMDSLKSRFFANISHEFRTPLTLIIGPVHRLLNQKADPDDQPYLQTIERNAQRLLQLVNQLLDLAKLDANKLKLEAIKSDLVAFLRVRATAFSSLAEDKQIDYTIALPEEKVGLYFDRDKLEKVINNLLSNAFKFTPPGGSVALTAQVVTQEGREWVQIQVKNSGEGIPPEVTPLIFDRFYQVENPEQPGSGIGLALTKELVELHYGSIEVESKEGLGTTFTLLLPIGKAHLKEAEIIQELPLPEETTEVKSDLHPAEFLSYSAEDKSTKQESKVTTEKPLILIVEDHPEVRAFIRDSLGTSYQTEEAKNGQEGVEIAKEMLPDLIISDVMMPEMDGYQLCEHIKSQELTSHIPVMLLTAKADRSSKLTGLELGANDYLAKPFDQEELRLLVRNRIDERQKMREHFSRQITIEPTSVKISSVDEQFLQTCNSRLLKTMLTDASFGIGDLTQEVGMSRAQLFRKLKALTDHTPGDFIRTIRLKRAADMLTQGAGNIADIAYQVGFQDPSYFTKAFQKQFGQTPSDYIAHTVT